MSTNRIDRRFAAHAAEGRAAFVAYVMGGDPDYATPLDILKGLPGAGVDLIEASTDGSHLDALIRFFQLRERRLRRQ